MYQPTTLLVTLLAGLCVLALTKTTLTFSNNYDDADLPLKEVTCSTGTHGLENKGYTTLGSLPSFPNVGAFDTVTGPDSPACGTCYAVTYGDTTVYILAVDSAASGIAVSEETMNNLTGGNAARGKVEATFNATSASKCGLSSS